MPPSFKLTEETLGDLESFLKLFPPHTRQAIEFRHSSWIDPQVFDLLNQYNAGWVSAHSQRFTSHTTTTGGFAYLRMHGPTKLYASSYPEEDLEALAHTIQGFLKSQDVYIYFNNDFNAYAIQNGRRLMELVNGTVVRRVS